MCNNQQISIEVYSCYLTVSVFYNENCFKDSCLSMWLGRQRWLTVIEILFLCHSDYFYNYFSCLVNGK